MPVTHRMIEPSVMSYLANGLVNFPYLVKINELNINKVWNVLEPYIKINLKYGVHTETKRSVYDLLLSGHSQLWLNKDSFVITVIQTISIGKALVVGFAYGNKDNCIEMVDGKIKEWAKSMGCKNIVINGRLGWKRFLKKNKFKPKAIILVKEI